MLADAVRRHRIASYLAVTYAVTWGAWIPLAVAGREVAPGLEPAYLLGLCGPLIGALVTTGLADGRRGLRDLVARMVRVRVGLRWWLLALALPLAAYATMYAVLAAYSMFMLAPVQLPTWHSLGQFNGFPVTNALAMAVWLVAVNGFGEETGWRGFLVPAFHRHHSPLATALLVAACWALWHAPAFFITQTYREMPAAMIPMFFVGLLCASVFLTWLYLRGGRSIALVAVFHGVYNLMSGSVGARGVVASVESTVVMVFAAVLAIQQLAAAHGHAGDSWRGYTRAS